MAKSPETDPAVARLAAAAAEALKAAQNSPARAVEGFLEQTLAEPELLTALMRVSRTQLHAACYGFLTARAAKKTSKEIGSASLGGVESQSETDRVAEDQDESCQMVFESQFTNDRPVLVHQHRRAAPASKIAKGAALAYATTSIFARQIGSGIKQVGEVTKFDVLQIKRRGMIDSTVADGLLELDWPDEDKTPLHWIASEQQVTAVFNRAYKALDALGITHASQR